MFLNRVFCVCHHHMQYMPTCTAPEFVFSMMHFGQNALFSAMESHHEYDLCVDIFGFDCFHCLVQIVAVRYIPCYNVGLIRLFTMPAVVVLLFCVREI